VTLVAPPVLPEDRLDPAALDAALREHGGLFVTLSRAGALAGRMLDATRWFFSLPPEEKAALAIERSPHFRGWSEMRNERDWREQLHLGRERGPAGDEPAFRRLEGPNLWPADAAWRGVASAHTGAAAVLGERILQQLARVLGADPAGFAGVGSDGYLVAKLIGYHPQPSAGTARSGVAAHVDFSWLTINLQDSEGLEVRRPDGVWTPVAVRPGVVWVHVGELLEHATQGRYRATPHRVVNPSSTRTRVSIPVFVNPPLDAWVPVLAERPPRADRPARRAGGHHPEEHVHRVLAPGAVRRAFHFGRAEWRRKGLAGWCFACCPAQRSNAQPISTLASRPW
jgi:isopenicillin N synthase-like dioxygenase